MVTREAVERVDDYGVYRATPDYRTELGELGPLPEVSTAMNVPEYIPRIDCVALNGCVVATCRLLGSQRAIAFLSSGAYSTVNRRTRNWPPGLRLHVILSMPGDAAIILGRCGGVISSRRRFLLWVCLL